MDALNYGLAGFLIYLMLSMVPKGAEKDLEPPQIDLLFPANNHVFKSDETINFRLSDNIKIKNVNFIIDGKKFSAKKIIPPNFKKGKFEMSLSALPFDICSMGSGNHSLTIEVSDKAKNTTSSETITFSASSEIEYDCSGKCDGKAFKDDCGVCSGDDTKHEANSDIDCNGDCFGTATIDDCDICSGGNTNLEKNSDMDCNGDCGGIAYLDTCGVCSEGNSNHIADSDLDCNGDCFGTATIDDCDICSGGNTNLEKNSDIDCNGDCKGTAFLDTCGVCSGGNSNHIKDSDLDCNGDCFGTAFIDDCQICSGGNTTHTPNSDMDCNGDCFGTAKLDECGVCSEGNTGHISNSDKDCNGDCFGTAEFDQCGICSGGNTDFDFNKSVHIIKNHRYICNDMMFVVDLYSIKYPDSECIPYNDQILNECIDTYLGLETPSWSTQVWSNGRLVEFLCEDCNLSGNLPLSFAELDKLRRLDVSNNNFSGVLSDKICDINSIDIYDNKFCPPYPECVTNTSMKFQLSSQNINNCK